MGESIQARVRAVLWPVAGFVLVYLLFVLAARGRHEDVLAFQGAMRTGRHVRRADSFLLETITTASVLLALVTLVVIGGLRRQWRTAVRSTAAVLGALLSAEVLKRLLPSLNWWDGQWRWLSAGSFPSGHTVVVSSISLAVLSVSSPAWRRWLLGPLAAGTAVATTGLVTIGWHRPSDVLAGFFLATAWHRALAVRRPVLATPSRSTVLWWAAGCLLVLAAGFIGLHTHLQPSRHAAVSYLVAQVLILIGALITVGAGRPGPGAATGERGDLDEAPVRAAP